MTVSRDRPGSRCPTEPSVSTRPLPLEFSLLGTAELTTADGSSVSCLLELSFELSEPPRQAPQMLEYDGVHGGSIRRTVLDPAGNGISLWPDVHGAVIARSIAPAPMAGAIAVPHPPSRVVNGRARPMYLDVPRRSEFTGPDSQEMRQASPSRVPRITLPRLSLALVALNILWRVVRYSLGFPLWGDEAFVAMNLIHRDFSGLISPLDYGQIAPLGFMWAELAVARVLGLSEWALRLLPFVAGVLSMLLFWRFAQKTLNRWDAALAVAIFAASYFPVRHASEVKPYAGDLLVALVLIALAWSVYEKPESRKRWTALIAGASVGIWLSFPSAFVIGAIGLLLTHLVVSRRDTRLLGPWLVLGLSVTLSFTAMYLLYANPHAAAAWPADDASTIEEWGRGFPPLASPWRLPAWLWDVHSGNMLSYPYGGRQGVSTVTMLAVLVGAASLWRTRKALLLLLLGPLAFNFIAAALRAYPYGTSARFALYMAPAFCLLAGIGSMSVIKTVRSPRQRVRWVHGIVFFMLSLILGGMAWNLIHPYKNRSDRESRRVLRGLSRQAGPSDQWISFNAQRPESPQIDRSWRRCGGTAVYRYYLSRLAPVSLHWAPDPTSVTGAPGSRIWLLAFKEPGMTFDEDRLDDYVDSLSERLGPGEQVSRPLQNGKGSGELAIYRFTVSGTPLSAPAVSSVPLVRQGGVGIRRLQPALAKGDRGGKQPGGNSIPVWPSSSSSAASDGRRSRQPQQQARKRGHPEG